MVRTNQGNISNLDYIMVNGTYPVEKISIPVEDVTKPGVIPKVDKGITYKGEEINVLKYREIPIEASTEKEAIEKIKSMRTIPEDALLVWHWRGNKVKSWRKNG